MKELKFLQPRRILPALADKVDEFYLAGGTALSMMYYQHRESYDLDFFTRTFNSVQIEALVDELGKKLGAEIELQAEQLKEGLARIKIYLVSFPDGGVCKLDFVEDAFELSEKPRVVDGIPVMPLRDIYLRKVFTVAGHIQSENDVGQQIMTGGRQEAKDFYDLYVLSTTHRPLAEFVIGLHKPVLLEGVIAWFQSYDRMTIRTGLLDLITPSKPDYRIIERHFEEQIDKLTSYLIEGMWDES